MEQVKKRLLAFGDSIIKGVVMDNSESTRYKVSENSITDLCARTLGIESHNYGKFGCTVTSGNNILERQIGNIEKSDLVILEYGGNDGDYSWQDIARQPDIEHQTRTPLSVFSKTYRQIISKIKQIGATPIVLSLPPIDPVIYFKFFSQRMNDEERSNVIDWLEGNLSNISNGHELYNLETLHVACDMCVKWIDISSPFLQIRDYRSLLCPDGLHPNESGQKLIATQILSAL